MLLFSVHPTYQYCHVVFFADAGGNSWLTATNHWASSAGSDDGDGDGDADGDDDEDDDGGDGDDEYDCDVDIMGRKW